MVWQLYYTCMQHLFVIKTVQKLCNLPICNFLLAINTNLHSISHYFQVIADYWSNLRFQLKVKMSLTQSIGVNPKTQDYEILLPIN